MTLKIVPKRGTIVPEMSTAPYKEDISQTLFGKTRRAVLSLLYSHVDEAFYLRQIVRVAGVGLGAVQRELKLLSDAGITQRIVRGRQVYYQANPQCPVFGELKALVIKTVGIAAIVQAALAPLADHIRIAGIYGSIARSEEHRGSDVDLLVVGKVTFAEIVSALDQAQKTINREINPTVYPVDEFQSKLSAGHHFLSTIVEKPMFFLFGDKRELARLAKKRLAG
ncbi:MAG: nucleotidyltransferase domain-containing protein [Thermodesulfobacteriota bacterium]|nr:nucleotidyltransferase domain-containing protein [Thermodesulfobacteriota bacterium]